MSEDLLPSTELSPSEQLFEKFPYLKSVDYRLLTSIDDVEKYLEARKPEQPIALDLETSGLNPKKHHIVGVALTLAEHEGVYIPTAHTVRPELNVPMEDLIPLLNRLFDEEGHPMIVHNQKFEGNFLGEVKVRVKHWLDCLVSAYLNDSNLKTGLKFQTEHLFGIKQVDFGDCFPKVKKKDWDFANVDPEVAYLYACGDVDFTLRVWNRTAPAREEQSFIWKVENKLTDVIRRMEQRGFALDVDYYRRLAEEVQERIEAVEERIYSVVGRTIPKKVKKKVVEVDPETQEKKKVTKEVEEEVELNLASTQHMGKKLFTLPKEEGGLEIPNPHRTASGKVGTSASVMESMKDAHPVISDLLLLRKLKKCKSTYIMPFIKDSDEDGLGRFSLRQCGAPTGRMAGSKGGNDSGYIGVNVQSIPAAEAEYETAWVFPKGASKPCSNAVPTQYLDPEPTYICMQKDCSCDRSEAERRESVEYWEIPNIRKGFVGREGYSIVAIDYSGIELRIATNLSKEPVWLEEFSKPDPDLHKASAIEIYGPDVVNDPAFKGKRGNAKTCNFAVLFGGSGATVAAQIEGMTRDEGYDLVDNFYKGLSTLKRWIKGMHAEGRKNHCIWTYFKRKRPLHMYKDNNPKTRKGSWAYGDRSTVSTAVQGSAADVMKIALVRLDKVIEERGWQEDVLMHLSIHDECVFEVKTPRLHEIIPVLVKAMEFEVKGWPVPLVCDVEIGSSWGDGIEHRVVDGRLVSKEEVSKAAEEGREISFTEEPNFVSTAGPPEEAKEVEFEEPEEITEEPKKALDPTVTLVFKSVMSRRNVEAFQEVLSECVGNTDVRLRFAGEAGIYALPKKVDVVGLMRKASERGLSVSVQS